MCVCGAWMYVCGALMCVCGAWMCVYGAWMCVCGQFECIVDVVLACEKALKCVSDNFVQRYDRPSRSLCVMNKTVSVVR